MYAAPRPIERGMRHPVTLSFLDTFVLLAAVCQLVLQTKEGEFDMDSDSVKMTGL
jgi:hypothetical protein